METPAPHPFGTVTLRKDVRLHCEKQLPRSKNLSVYFCTQSVSIHRNSSRTRTGTDQFLTRVPCPSSTTTDTAESHSSAPAFNVLLHTVYQKAGKQILLVLQTTTEGTERSCDFLKATLCSTTGTTLLFPST